MPGVTGVEAVRYFGSEVGDQTVTVIARDFNDPKQFPVVLAKGEPEDVRSRLLAGEVVLGTVLAQRSGLNVGESIRMQTPDGPRKLRIAGLVVDYTVGGNVVGTHLATARRIFHVQGADIFLVRARPEAIESVRGLLKTSCEKSGLMLHSFAELSRLLDGIMSGILRGLWGLLALGFIVAGFGIGNTLMMNVLEQTREIAMMRVLGMTRWQVRKMILTQAIIIGIVGLGLGVIAGVNTAYIMSLCMQPLLGYTIRFALPVVLIIGSFVMAFLIVLAAAWVPAGRATKLDLMVALQYE
jgi:putative ABC transport system permease protein